MLYYFASCLSLNFVLVFEANICSFTTKCVFVLLLLLKYFQNEARNLEFSKQI